MTKSVPSPPQRQSVDHPPPIFSQPSSSPMPNELHSFDSENCPIRATFDGLTNFELKHRPSDLASPSLSLFSVPKIPFNNRQMPICVQCSQVIIDRFILRVHPNLEFHTDCLKCSECGRPLHEHRTAFVRDGKTLCREDYFRLIGPRCPHCPRCARCDVQIPHSEMKMSARHLLFHLNCFTCFHCHRMLMPGDQILFHHNEVFCRPECLMLMQPFHLSNGHQVVPPSSHVVVAAHSPDLATLQPPQNIGDGPPFELAALGSGASVAIGPQNNVAGGANFLPSAFGRPGLPPNCSSALSQMASSGASPLSYSNPDESLTPSSTNASTPTAPNGQIGGGQPYNGTTSNNNNNLNNAMLQGNFEAIGNGGGGIAHFANSAGGGSNCSSSSSSVVVHKGKKSKKDKPAQRVRTVLNENQLRILKQTYQGNQRPDTNTKEQLVEMTGLNARVIRVWFQNKRCKDKKRQIEQREKQQSQEKDQTIRSVRAVGVGPMTVSSPGPAQLVDQQQGNQQQFLTPVEIRQFSQNTRLWDDQPPMGGPPTQMDVQFHANGTPSLMMPNSTSVEFLHPPPPNANFQSLSNGMQLFPQQAMSD